jgi:hypothetical protein
LNHVELYNVVQDLACYGYSGIDNASRVRKLLSGIKTDQLDSVKNQVMSDQDLATDFDRVVNLFNDFLAHKRALSKNNNSSAGIAAQNTGRKDRKRRGEEENHNQNSRRRTTNISAVDIKDRYYTPQ